MLSGKALTTVLDANLTNTFITGLVLITVCYEVTPQHGSQVNVEPDRPCLLWVNSLVIAEQTQPGLCSLVFSWDAHPSLSAALGRLTSIHSQDSWNFLRR